MTKLRWQIAVVLATLVVVATLLFSQQPVSGPAEPQAAAGGIYTEAITGSLGRLNPLLDWNNRADRDVDRLLFSGLVRFDARGLPVPDIAESWGTSADGTVYNFTLRPNALWHDGTAVTADDVIFTIGLLKTDSLFPADVKDLWSRIEVQRLDDRNLSFTLPEPYAPFLDYATFGILPEHLLSSTPAGGLGDSAFNLKPVGTGPYMFEKLLVDSGRVTGVVLQANPKYYNPEGYIQQVIFRYFPDSQTAWAAYEQGEVLGVGEVPADILSKALSNTKLSLYTSRLPMLSMVLLNTKSEDAPFLDVAVVRHALLLGLDRDRMVASVFDGQASVVDGPILPYSWAYYDGLERVIYDPAGAESLLKSEGYVLPASGESVRAKDSISLTLTLIYPDDAQHAKVAGMISSDWSRIGVQVTLKAVPYDQMASTYLAPHTFQAALVDLNFARTPDPDPYPFWHQAEISGGQNYAQWDSRPASEYLESARTETDFTVRARLYRNFQVLFAKEVPSIPLFVPVYNYAVDAQVHGVQVPPLSEPSDRLNTFAEWYLLSKRTVQGAQAGATP